MLARVLKRMQAALARSWEACISAKLRITAAQGVAERMRILPQKTLSRGRSDVMKKQNKGKIKSFRMHDG